VRRPTRDPIWYALVAIIVLASGQAVAATLRLVALVLK
jgi:hypothetical protein